MVEPGSDIRVSLHKTTITDQKMNVNAVFVCWFVCCPLSVPPPYCDRVTKAYGSKFGLQSLGDQGWLNIFIHK